jgi:hypothetical protein
MALEIILKPVKVLSLRLGLGSSVKPTLHALIFANLLHVLHHLLREWDMDIKQKRTINRRYLKSILIEEAV